VRLRPSQPAARAPQTYVGQWLRVLVLGPNDERVRLGRTVGRGQRGAWDVNEPAVVAIAGALIGDRLFGSPLDRSAISDFVTAMRHTIQTQSVAPKPDVPDQLDSVTVIENVIALQDFSADSEIPLKRQFSICGLFFVFAAKQLMLTTSASDTGGLTVSDLDRLIADAETTAFARGFTPPLSPVPTPNAAAAAEGQSKDLPAMDRMFNRNTQRRLRDRLEPGESVIGAELASSVYNRVSGAEIEGASPAVWRRTVPWKKSGGVIAYSQLRLFYIGNALFVTCALPDLADIRTTQADRRVLFVMGRTRASVSLLEVRLTYGASRTQFVKALKQARATTLANLSAEEQAERIAFRDQIASLSRDELAQPH
jgi:hypothetical protein